MKNKILNRVVAFSMLACVNATVLAPTISAKADVLTPTAIREMTVNNLNDFLFKYELNEADLKDFMNSVENDLNSSMNEERGAVSNIKNALKIILKYADKLPSWVSTPLKKLFQPLMNALNKVVDISLGTLRSIMISVGFNPTVADFIIDIIDLFFL